MRQRELLVEGLIHFFFICQWGKENFSLRGWHIFLLCQQDNKHCPLRFGGEVKKSMRQRELHFEGLTLFFYLSIRQRELLVEGLTYFFHLSTRQTELHIGAWQRITSHRAHTWSSHCIYSIMLIKFLKWLKRLNRMVLLV